MCVFLPSVLEKSEFKDDSQFFRFYADEEMEGTSSKSKQLQRNDFKLIENILAKSLVVSWHAGATLLLLFPKQAWYWVILHVAMAFVIYALAPVSTLNFFSPSVL